MVLRGRIRILEELLGSLREVNKSNKGEGRQEESGESRKREGTEVE